MKKINYSESSKNINLTSVLIIPKSYQQVIEKKLFDKKTVNLIFFSHN